VTLPAEREHRAHDRNALLDRERPQDHVPVALVVGDERCDRAVAVTRLHPPPCALDARGGALGRRGEQRLLRAEVVDHRLQRDSGRRRDAAHRHVVVPVRAERLLRRVDDTLARGRHRDGTGRHSVRSCYTH
jgi:hypothetical protein